MNPIEIDWIKKHAKEFSALNPGMTEAQAETTLAQQAFRQLQLGAEGGQDSWNNNAQNFLKRADSQSLPDGGYMFFATLDQRANSLMYIGASIANSDFYARNGLGQPSQLEIKNAVNRITELTNAYGSATKSAFMAAATIALGGLPPTMLTWVLAHPVEANIAGIITIETAVAITSGAVTPTTIIQASPQLGKLSFAAVELFEGGNLTKAGRALTKHPEILDLTKANIRQTVNTEAELNRISQSIITNVLVEGERTVPILPRYGAVIQIQIPGGFGALWTASGDFIGFINP